MDIPTLTLSATDRAALTSACRALAEIDVVSETEEFVLEAQVQSGRLSGDLRRSLLRFRRFGEPDGVLLLRGVPVGNLPPTPERPEALVGPRGPGGAALSVIVACLGEQFGFAEELSGNVVQDILPVRGFEDQQVSISSAAELGIHTETSFSPHRPDYVGLLCLRPDQERRAITTISSIDSILPLLDASTIEVLREPRFQTDVDPSFLFAMGKAGTHIAEVVPILEGPPHRSSIQVDFISTKGTDRRAQEALNALGKLVVQNQHGVRLESEDVLILDNTRVVHGRSAFRARYDGADRWLLRTFVTRDLGRSGSVRPRDGRMIQSGYATELSV
jgi:L-asparagine oxygenase